MLSLFGRNHLSEAKYTPLGSPHVIPPKEAYRLTRATIIRGTVLVLALSFVSSISFLAGRHVSTQKDSNVLNLSSHPHVFEYTRMFAERPNTTTDKAWHDLFPTQGGFFKHPQLAPKRATFAVFHQLHCLDGIRQGYWILLDKAAEGNKINVTELPFHASARHIRHCIDLLRNALMCQPDLTLEVKDEELGGVTGFGTEHQCIDWKELVDWTTEWETYQQRPGGKMKPHSHESKHNGHAEERHF